MSVIDLPGEVKPGHEVKAEDYNALLRALRSSIIQPGVGYQRTINRSGTTLKISRQDGPHQRPGVNPAFSVIEVNQISASTFSVMLEPGRVCSANPVAAAQTPAEDGYDYFVPEIGGTPMDEKDSDGGFPFIQVSDGEAIYCQIRRDAMGEVVEPVEMVVLPQEELSAHYQPPDPPEPSGTEEVYQLRRILDLNVTAGEAEFKVWRVSDIDLEPFLWAGDNVGDGAGVYKQHDQEAGIYEFRRVKGDYGIKETENVLNIDLEFEGENIGSGNGGIGEVYNPEGSQVNPLPPGQEPDHKAQFKMIAQGLSGRDEIEIVNDADVVRIQGNGTDGTITHRVVDSGGSPTDTVIQEFVDGLATIPGDKIIETQDGDTLPLGARGDIMYHNGLNWTVLASPGLPPRERWILIHEGDVPLWGDSDNPL